MLLQVYLQFCDNSGFVATSGVIMLFCPLLDDSILRMGYAVVKQEKLSHSAWFDECSVYYALTL